MMIHRLYNPVWIQNDHIGTSIYNSSQCNRIKSVIFVFFAFKRNMTIQTIQRFTWALRIQIKF